jgi:dihydroxy-acid dehydratase
VGENIAGARVFNDDVIRPLENPIYKEGALAVLRGNLAPEGCVIKPSAMDPRFLKHAGPALVFDDYVSSKPRWTTRPGRHRDSVLVLRNAGPQGGPGMPDGACCPCRRSC